MKNNQDTPKNKAAGLPTQTAQNKQFNAQDTTSKNQRAIILVALRTGAKTTIQLRHDYGVMQPAVRVFELKRKGFLIDTLRIDSYTPDGVRHHKVACYVLRTSNDTMSEVMP